MNKTKVITKQNKEFVREKRIRILKTIMCLVIFRILTHIPAPFLRGDINKMLKNNFLVFSVFSGGAFNNLSLLATGVSSYITATIIIQLLASSFDELHRIKRTPGGKVLLDKYTYKVAIGLSMATSLGFIYLFQAKYQAFGPKPNFYIICPVIMLFHLLGTFLTIKISKFIDNKGIKNGLSLLIALNIANKLPNLFMTNKNMVKTPKTKEMLILSLIFIFVMFFLIIICEKSERRIDVEFGKIKTYKNNIYDEKDSYFPLKLNLGGVMPLILAASFTTIITFILERVSYKYPAIQSFIKNNPDKYLVCTIVLTSIFIFIFAFSYVDITVNHLDLSEDMLVRSCCIKNIPQGRMTAKFLEQTIKGLTLGGATYLFLVSLIPAVVFRKANFNSLGVTSVIILVSVSCVIVDSLDLVKTRN